MSSSSKAKILAAIENLDDAEAEALEQDWEFYARNAQLPPEGDWFIWLLLGGRGAGKTRAGAEWVAERVRAGHARRVALIAATHSDARRVMIEGDSGLLKFAGGAEYFPSIRKIVWAASGAEAFVLSAEEPDSIRGYQFDTAWCDEFCKWPEAQAALDMVLMGLRMGESKMMISTTPRPIPALKALVAREDCVRTTSTTREGGAASILTTPAPRISNNPCKEGGAAANSRPASTNKAV